MVCHQAHGISDGPRHLKQICAEVGACALADSARCRDSVVAPQRWRFGEGPSAQVRVLKIRLQTGLEVGMANPVLDSTKRAVIGRLGFATIGGNISGVTISRPRMLRYVLEVE